jgi:hypothetical protein
LNTGIKCTSKTNRFLTYKSPHPISTNASIIDIHNDNSWKNVLHATRLYTLILQVTTSVVMQIALSAKKRSQIQNTGAT